MPVNDRLKNIRKIEFTINKNLFIVCSVITVVTMALSLIDFFTRGRFVPARMNLFYLTVVAIYSFHKEIIRWLGEKKVKRQGEYFVYSWVILTTILYIVNFFSHDYFSYSAEGYPLGTLRDISYLTVQVLAFFIFTRILKLLFLLKK